jgi:glycosyltransferase involved in cell wall biosynthesis
VRSVAKRVAYSKPDVVIYLYRAGDGGLDRVAILLANGFAARGLLTEIWLTHDEGESRFLISDNVTVRMLPQRKRTRRGRAMLFQIPALVKMVRQYRPRILLSAGNQSNLAVAVAAKLGGRTAAFQKITNPIARPKTQNKMQWLRNQRFAMTARLGTRTLVLSEADAQASTILTPDIGHRFIVMPNPYVTDNMLALGHQRLPRAVDEVPQMLAVARFCEQKDHATLLNALALLIHRSWHLTLVGDGPLRGAIEDQTRALGLLDRITFAGFIKDPLPFYAASDLLILSSRWEGLPATPIEALACGNMVVATDCAPGLTEFLIDAGLPTPVPIADPAALATAIANALDDPLCLKRARQSAERYSVASSVEAHLAAFAPWLSPNGMNVTNLR